MTDTSEAEQAAGQPQTNGFADDGIDDDERGKMRPADIDADVREMERRKRVEMIMNSRLFREELERIIESQMKEGGTGPGGLLQQLSDMMGPGVGRLQSANMFRSSNCVVPINDIRGVESMGYAKGEKLLRCKLASVYRLIDLYGWTQGIHNHITARLNQDEEQFLVNPWGIMYHEVTASSLVKVDMQGNTVEAGTTNFGVNRESFKLHAAIHSARPDIKCIIHTHTASVVAVSSLKAGLLPLCHEALVIGDVSTHQYIGGVYDAEEQEKIARNLGPINKVLFLTNHGAVCCGETVEEAFFNVYNTVQACETQIKLMPLGLDNLVLLPEETRKRVYDAARRPPEGHVLDKDKEVTSPTIADRKEKRWRVGGTEFEALMRMLDNAGFRTGYIYRNPLVKGDPPRPRNDIEVPPAVSSLGYLLEEEEWYKQGGWRKFADGRKSHDRTRWLNSPNVYQKVEILETGTPDPKKITKWVDANADEWVADGSPTHSSTPVKINTLQFVPKNTNPKEFKKLQQQIKENRRADKITSGPQSHILEGVSWEEAKKMQDANISQTGDQVILVGAASKGIIQRGFQHNAMVYKAPYAKNPFDTVTEEELEEYKRTVGRKARGEPYDDSESEALSSSAAARPPTGKSPTSPTSETEEESRDEPRVLRIETKQAPRPIQAEVVLSDDSDYPDAVMERSKSARFPQKATPDLVTAPSSIGRSWSLGRSKRSSRVNLPDPSSPRLQRLRHYHHPRYVNLPVSEATARPVSPCSITRFSSVAEPIARNPWTNSIGLARFYSMPCFPMSSATLSIDGDRSLSCATLSIDGDRSLGSTTLSIDGDGASSIDGDSCVDDLCSSAVCAPPPALAPAPAPAPAPALETFRVRVTELPRLDRAVLGSCSQLSDAGSATEWESNDEHEVTVLQADTPEDGQDTVDAFGKQFRNTPIVVDWRDGEEGRYLARRIEVREGDLWEVPEPRNPDSSPPNGNGPAKAADEAVESEAVVSSDEDTIVEDRCDEDDATVVSAGNRERASTDGETDFSEEEVERGEGKGLAEKEVFRLKDQTYVIEKELIFPSEEEKQTVFGQEHEELVPFEEAEEVVPFGVEQATPFEKLEHPVVSKINKEEFVPFEEAEEEVSFEAEQAIPIEQCTPFGEAEEMVSYEAEREEYLRSLEVWDRNCSVNEVGEKETVLVQEDPMIDIPRKWLECIAVSKFNEDEAEPVAEETCPDEPEVAMSPYKQHQETHRYGQEEETILIEQAGERVTYALEKEVSPHEEEQETIPCDREQETLPCEQGQETFVDEQEHETFIDKREGETCFHEQEQDAYPYEENQETLHYGQEEETILLDQAGEMLTDKPEKEALRYEWEQEALSYEQGQETFIDKPESETFYYEQEQDAYPYEQEQDLYPYEEDRETRHSGQEEKTWETFTCEQTPGNFAYEPEKKTVSNLKDQEIHAYEEDRETYPDEQDPESYPYEQNQETYPNEQKEETTTPEEMFAYKEAEKMFSSEQAGETFPGEHADEAFPGKHTDEAFLGKHADEAFSSKQELDTITNQQKAAADAPAMKPAGKKSRRRKKRGLANNNMPLADVPVHEKVAETFTREEADWEVSDGSVRQPIADRFCQNSILASVENSPGLVSSFDNGFLIPDPVGIPKENDDENQHGLGYDPDDVSFSCHEDPEESVSSGRCEFSPVPYRICWPSDECKGQNEFDSGNVPEEFCGQVAHAGGKLTSGEFFHVGLAASKSRAFWKEKSESRPMSPSDDLPSRHPAAEADGYVTGSMSSGETIHFGRANPKGTASFWESGSLPALSRNLSWESPEKNDRRHGYDDTESVKSWVDGRAGMGDQIHKADKGEDELNSTFESTDNELEWSGAFTKQQTYDEGKWSSSGQKRPVKCGSIEGGGEGLFDQPDVTASDKFFSPLSNSSTDADAEFFSPVSTFSRRRPSSESDSPYTSAAATLESDKKRTSQRMRRRSSSLGDITAPTNTFRFSWDSSENLPKVQVTQTVSLTGSLSNKRVDVQTTVVSNKEGGRCLMTKVTCTSAGHVDGRLYEKCTDRSSPLELGRWFTLKGRGNVQQL